MEYGYNENRFVMYVKIPKRIIEKIKDSIKPDILYDVSDWSLVTADGKVTGRVIPAHPYGSELDYLFVEKFTEVDSRTLQNHAFTLQLSKTYSGWTIDGWEIRISIL